MNFIARLVFVECCSTVLIALGRCKRQAIDTACGREAPRASSARPYRFRLLVGLAGRHPGQSSMVVKSMPPGWSAPCRPATAPEVSGVIVVTVRTPPEVATWLVPGGDGRRAADASMQVSSSVSVGVLRRASASPPVARSRHRKAIRPTLRLRWPCRTPTSPKAIHGRLSIDEERCSAFRTSWALWTLLRYASLVTSSAPRGAATAVAKALSASPTACRCAPSWSTAAFNIAPALTAPAAPLIRAM